MRRYISSITPSLFALLVTLCVAVPGFAQSTTIRGGNSANTAAVSNSALSGTEAGLVVRCASGCSGSGGGGAVTVADGADATLGTTTDEAATAGGTGTISAKLRIATTLLDAIKTAVESGATAANQATLNGYVDGLEALLTTIDTDTGNIATSTSSTAARVGDTTDAAATAGGEGTVSAKLRNATELLDTGNTTLSTLNAKLPSAGALGDDMVNPTTTGVASYNMCFDGSTWDRCVKATADSDGVQTVRTHAKLTDRVSNVVGITDGSSTSVIAAQGSGVRFCATTIVVSNSSATNVTVDLRDGTAGSVLMTIPAAANMGGGVVPLPVPICTTANTAMAADPSAAASTVTITAVGFKTSL